MNVAVTLVVSLTVGLFLNSCGGSSGGGGTTQPPPAPTVSFSSSSVAFGNQTLNTASHAKSVTLSNTGSAALNISSLAVGGANAADFSESNTCGSSLAANANCTISVTFEPATTGAFSASVNVTDNANGSPQSVALTGTGVQPVTAPTATLTASSTSATQFQPLTLTIATTGATSCSASASPADSAWTGTVTCNGSVIIQPTVSGTVAYSVAATGPGGTANASVTVNVAKATPVSISVTPATASISTTGTTALTASVTNGTGNATVAWSISPAVGTLSPTSGDVTTYTPPTTLSSSPTTVTITATATDATGTATATASITVTRVITLTQDPAKPLPDNEIYSDFGAYLANALQIDCTNCESTDTVTTGSPISGYNTATIAQTGNPFYLGFNSTGYFYVPVLFKTWVSGTDGVTSNLIWTVFKGSANVAAQDTSSGNSASGEIYYAYSGNGTQGSISIQKYKQDGTVDGSFSGSGYGIAADNQTHDILTANEHGISVILPSGTGVGVTLPNSTSPANFLGVSALDGLGCATAPLSDLAYFLSLPTQPQTLQPFQLPGIPAGSQPTACAVIDSSHIVIYGRGDQTLRWYVISGTTATASGSLQLTSLTLANASFWQQYLATGGWDMVMVGNTIGVMGQVVNSDTTVSQKLALVNNTTQALTQYVDLPAGIVHIAADPTNNAIAAEYPDLTATPAPITRFARISVSTGKSAPLTSTSALVPGAGFLITLDGSDVAVCVNGDCDFEPNQ